MPYGPATPSPKTSSNRVARGHTRGSPGVVGFISLEPTGDMPAVQCFSNGTRRRSAGKQANQQKRDTVREVPRRVSIHDWITEIADDPGCLEDVSFLVYTLVNYLRFMAAGI